MGVGHVMVVREDGLINLAGASEGLSAHMAEEIGRAIVKLCLDPNYLSEPQGLTRHK